MTTMLKHLLGWYHCDSTCYAGHHKHTQGPGFIARWRDNRWWLDHNNCDLDTTTPAPTDDEWMSAIR